MVTVRSLSSDTVESLENNMASCAARRQGVTQRPRCSC
jgi:hypothetical protein